MVEGFLRRHDELLLNAHVLLIVTHPLLKVVKARNVLCDIQPTVGGEPCGRSPTIGAQCTPHH